MKKRIGVISGKNKVFMIRKPDDASSYLLEESLDGVSFTLSDLQPKIAHGKQRENLLGKGSGYRITAFDDEYILTFQVRTKRQAFVYKATSKDLVDWRDVTKLSSIHEKGMIVPSYQYKDEYMLIFGEKNIQIAFSKDLKTWHAFRTLAMPRTHSFDNKPLIVDSVFNTNEGILVFYNVLGPKDSDWMVGIALFDTNEPTKLLFRSPKPIWEQSLRFPGKTAHPLGVVRFHDTYISYWDVEDEGIFSVLYHLPIPLLPRRYSQIFSFIRRVKENPLIKPIAEHLWESKATFNTAALYEDGKVHLVYRAIGESDTSVLGYAASSDGVSFSERSKEPIYFPTEPFEFPSLKNPGYHSPYASGGGGYGGCEDPRLTKIGDRIYMTYVAHNGSSVPRIALTSIALSDFLQKNWVWERPVLISPPDVVDKNAVIFPEKINGKYVIFHRIFPNILVDYVDDLSFDGSTFLKCEYKIEPIYGAWDSRKIGAGPPPIKTKDGWLLIYHAVDDNDASRYKVGAMILDASDPTQVLYRSDVPILEPVEQYENEGMKWGVVYPCGAVVIDDQLFMYYGGADMVVCAATTPLDTLLTALKNDKAHYY